MARQRRERAQDADRVLKVGNALQQRRGVAGRHLMNRQARERKAGDVGFFDRATSVVKPIEGRLGDELQPGGRGALRAAPAA